MTLTPHPLLVPWSRKSRAIPYNRTLWSLVSIKGVLGVKVYCSRHPMSKRTGDTGVAKIRQGRKTRGIQQPWRQGDGAEVRHLDPGSIRD